VAATDLSPPVAAVAPQAINPASSFADPGPLGLGAFALTTFMLSAFNAGLLDIGVESIVFSVALFYGGGVQIFAGLLEYVKGNTFGGTAFCSYGAFWLAFWGLGHFFAPGRGTTQSDVNQALGLFLLAWTIFTAYMFIASARTTTALFTVFGLLLLTFIALTAGKLADNPTLTHVGGYLGLVTALGAWYVSFAGVLSTTWKRAVLPVGPRT
jgi:succinate-acetate transporter protein